MWEVMDVRSYGCGKLWMSEVMDVGSYGCFSALRERTLKTVN